MTSDSGQESGSALPRAGCDPVMEIADGGTEGNAPGDGLGIERSEPPYQFIATQIRRQIASGLLRSGDRLPSSRELEGQFGHANMTIRRGVDVLRAEGLVYTVHGVGSFVGPRVSHSGMLKTVQRVRSEPARPAGRDRREGSGMSQQIAELLERVEILEEALWGSHPKQ